MKAATEDVAHKAERGRTKKIPLSGEQGILGTKFLNRIRQSDNMVVGRDHRLALRFLSG